MQTEEQGEIFSNIGKLLPDLFAVFDLEKLNPVYVNPAGLSRFDPNGTAVMEQLSIKDFIGMKDIDRFQREIYLQLRVRGFWMGSLSLRDMMGSEFQSQVKLLEVASAVPHHRQLYLHASIPHAVEQTQYDSVSDQDMLHALLETTPDRIAFKDANCRYLRISRTKAERHKLESPRDAIGKTDFDFFAVDHASKAVQEEQHVIKTGEPIIDREEKMTYEDGRVSWASTTRLPFHNRDGKLIGTYTVSHDITARKAVEERLRMLSRAVEQSLSSIVITDTQGQIEYVNPFFEKITGYTAEEVIGQNPRVLKSGTQPVEFYREMWETAVAGREWSGDMQNRRKNGEFFWERATISGIRNEQGKITHYVAVKEDITERRKAEEAQRESEALFKAVFSGSSDAILLFSDNKVFDCNTKAMEMFGYSREDLLKLHPADISPPEQPDGRDSLSAAMGYIEQALKNGSSVFEWIHRRKDNTCFPAEVMLSSFEFRGRSIVHGNVRDVSEKKQAELESRDMESRLQLSSKLESVGSLAAGVAHEINTPTQFISDNVRFLVDSFKQLAGLVAGYRAFVAEHPESDQKRAEIAALEKDTELDYLLGEVPRCLEQSQDGLRRISKIVGSLKEFSHPGGDEKSHADLNRAIETTIAVSRHEWKYVADVVTELDPNLPPVNCVLDEINQAVLNLVVNAAHAVEDAIKKRGDKRGAITIRTRTEAGQVIIEVQDTGTGIPEHVRGRIFEPFFTTKGIGKGTGQGLAIVQAVIVKKHHGTIGFATELGKGTIFKISLPIAPARTTPPLVPSVT